jgi:hypothetical protein
MVTSPIDLGVLAKMGSGSCNVYVTGDNRTAVSIMTRRPQAERRAKELID